MKKIVYKIWISSMIFSMTAMMLFLYSTKAAAYHSTYEKLLNTKSMYALEKHFMQVLVDDFMYLDLTKPKNSSEMTKQIMALKYKVDGPDEGLKSPSETMENGGDCEDMTLFIMARMWQAHIAKFGFMIICPKEFTDNGAHIVAIAEGPEKTIFVFDGTSKEVRTLQDSLLFYKRNTNYEYYRVHWLFEDNSQNKIMKILR